MRLSKRRLFQSLAYHPHPGQLLVHRSRARFRVLACGARWGKSTCAGMEAIAALFEPRDRAVGWLVAPTYDVCQRIFMRLCAVITEKLGHRVIEVSSREQKIVVTNLGGGTSELRCKSADHPAGLLGEALDFVIVDEAAQLGDQVWAEYLAPRLIDRKGTALVISTPQGPGWFYDMYRRGRKNRDPECESWASPSRDNPHIDPAIIEAERGRMPAEKFAQTYEAEFIGVPKEPCEQCGGPREDAVGSVTAPEGYGEDDDSFLACCPKCGMFVDESGRCIVQKWNRWAAGFDIDRPWIPSGSSYMWSALEEHDWK